MTSRSLWNDDAGFGAPIFVGNDYPFHPLTILGEDFARSASPWLAAAAVALLLRRRGRFRGIAAGVVVLVLLLFVRRLDLSLLVLGLSSTWLTSDRFVERPTRGRWVAFVLAVAIAVLGATPLAALVLFVPVVFALLWNVRHDARRWRAAVAGVACAALVAAALSALWWLPASRLRGEVATHAERLRRLPAERTRLAHPRFELAQRFIADRNEQRALRELNGSPHITTVDHIPKKIVRIAAPRFDRWETIRDFRGNGGALRVASYRAGTIRLSTRSEEWNLLVTSEPSWTGWRVYWNEERLPPVVVDTAFVGAFVPPGEGTLELRYRPDAYDDALRVGLAGLIIAVLFTAFLPRIREMPALGSELDTLDRCARFAARHILKIALTALLGYAAIITHNAIREVDGPDSSGYLNQTRLWQQRRLVIPIDVASEMRLPPKLSRLFTQVGFALGPEEQTLVPSYPAGLPLHMLPFRIAGGDAATFYAVPLIAIGCLLLMYLLGRELGLGRGLSVGAAVILGSFPTFVLHAVQPMSDVVATTWAIAAMLFARRAARNERWAVAAGVALGIGVLVRPTQLLLAPALLLALRLRPRRIGWMLLGGLPFALFQAGVDAALYGGPLASGYGNVLASMEWKYFPGHAAHYAHWLSALLTPIVFPVGFIFLLGNISDAFTRAALAAWFAAFFLFYCFYAPYDTWWYTRFLLPAVPALILGLLLAARDLLSDWRPSLRFVAAALLVGTIFGNSIHHLRAKFVLDTNGAVRRHTASIHEALKTLPERRLIVANSRGGAIYYYTGEMTIRSEAIDPPEFEQLRASALRAKRPLYAIVDEFEAEDLFRRAPGRWVATAVFRHVTVYRLDSGSGRGAQEQP